MINNKDINFAHIDWTDNTLPRSELFKDVYFSVAGGVNETIHNFIEGNNLPNRIKNLEEHGRFVIGETGFGTGSNLLIFAHLFKEEILQKKLNITFISFEKYPLTPKDMLFAHQNYANYPEITPDFLQQYDQSNFKNEKLIISLLQEHLKVIIYLGDIKDTIKKIFQEIKEPVDAWFLDGFAPSCNPDLWSDEVFATMSKTGIPGHSTFATFSVAGAVRRKAIAFGFDIEKAPGYGLKKEMLKGTLSLKHLE